jgi:uncharacterized protein YjbI with pentapeptide repeats
MDSTALTVAAIGVGGTVIVGVVGFWANVRNTDKTTALSLQGQVTDRYAKAIEQLGAKEIDVRLGGIYALERIAHDSVRDQPTVVEVLAAFARVHSHEQWPLPTTHEAGADPPGRRTRPDIQAAVTVIGRRAIRDVSQLIDLRQANLTHADLHRANLTGVNLYRAGLTSADLTRADLTDAVLALADLSGANLTDANLTKANLFHADLTGAYLTDSDLTRADLTRADLTNATLTRADLTRADLTNATLTHVDFTGANLTGAVWPVDKVLDIEGWQLDLEGWHQQEDGLSGRLKRADPNPGDPAAE